jgi:DNA-binding NarL/FixJ family response regulator
VATRILLVEDDATIREVLAASLRSHAYNVIWERTGADALTRAAAGAVDLIVLDLGLPDLEGTEAPRRPGYQRSRSRWTWSREDVEAALGLGIIGFAGAGQEVDEHVPVDVAHERAGRLLHRDRKCRPYTRAFDSRLSCRASSAAERGPGRSPRTNGAYMPVDWSSWSSSVIGPPVAKTSIRLPLERV